MEKKRKSWLLQRLWQYLGRNRAMLALALALSMFASFAFVLGPSTGVAGATNSALNITKFFTTYDASNLLAGTRLYAPIVDKTDSAFAKNELIQFCVEFEVLNAKTVANGVAPTKAEGTSTLVFTSDTVNLSVNQYPGQMALYADAGMPLVNAVTVINNAAGTDGAVYAAKKNSLTVDVNFVQDGSAAAFTATGINVDRMRIVGTVLSTVLGAVGILVYSQSYGFMQLYAAPRQMGFIAASAILIGGASTSRCKISHVIIGTFLFQGVLTLGMPVANMLVPGTTLSETLRILISNGIILYALTKSGGGSRA